MASRPEERYVKLETTTLPDGRVVYKSARPVSLHSTAADPTVVVGDADRLDVIANNVYGDPTAWWAIALVNGKVNGSLQVAPGTSLVIPKI